MMHFDLPCVTTDGTIIHQPGFSFPRPPTRLLVYVASALFSSLDLLQWLAEELDLSPVWLFVRDVPAIFMEDFSER